MKKTIRLREFHLLAGSHRQVRNKALVPEFLLKKFHPIIPRESCHCFCLWNSEAGGAKSVCLMLADFSSFLQLCVGKGSVVAFRLSVMSILIS